MPALKNRKPQPKPDAFYVAHTSAASNTFRISVGDRLRGDNPIVSACFDLFAPDGTDSHELPRRAQEYARTVEEQIPIEPVRLPVELRIRDEDAVVPRFEMYGIPLGTKLRKDDRVVREQPDAFVDVVPKGRTRANSYLALATLSHGQDDARRTVCQGQYIARDDELATINPRLAALIPSEDESDREAA